MNLFGRVHYAWVIVGLLSIVLALSHGLIQSGLSVFDPSILAELKATRGALQFREFIRMAVGGLSCLAIGFLADRVGPRPILYGGFVLFIGLLFSYAHVRSIHEIYLLYALIGIVYASSHTVLVVVIVSRWFAIRKGVAIGVILAGESIGSTIFPQINVALLQSFGWRESMSILIIVPCLCILLLALFLRPSPAQTGRQRYGEAALAAAAPTTATASETAARATFLHYWRQPGTFAVLAATIGVFYAGAGFYSHAFLSFHDRGLTPHNAALGLGLLFIAAFFGKVSAGFIADQWGTRVGWMVVQALFLAGGLIFTLSADPVFWLGVVLLGLGWGGCYSATQIIIAERFAGPLLGRLTGIFALCEALSSGLGAWLTGVAFDRTGNYVLGFLTICALIAMALIVTACSSVSFRKRDDAKALIAETTTTS